MTAESIVVEEKNNTITNVTEIVNVVVSEKTNTITSITDSANFIATEKNNTVIVDNREPTLIVAGMIGPTTSTTSIHGLTDVDNTNLSNKSILVYDSSVGKWITSTTLDDLEENLKGNTNSTETVTPSLDSTYSLGTPQLKYTNLYLSGNIYLGNVVITSVSFTDLNNKANTALNNSTSAIATANTALNNSNSAITTANNAVASANTALDNSNSAVTTANNAVTSANTALDNSNSAVTTANSAVTSANIAINTSNTAVTTANNAVASANTAINTSNSAVTTANTALSNSSTAITTANTAIDTGNSAYTLAQTVYDQLSSGLIGGINLIKTYNILNEFTAPLMGTNIFVPIETTTINKVQITNGEIAGVDIMLGLYRNNDLLTFLTLSAGQLSTIISGLNFQINTNDYITVNVVAGSGKNLTMAMYND
jgi:hypothetical protein